MCEFHSGGMNQYKHHDQQLCMMNTPTNVKAADQLCREQKSNQQIKVNRDLCYLDYKQWDQCNPEGKVKDFFFFFLVSLCHEKYWIPLRLTYLSSPFFFLLSILSFSSFFSSLLHIPSYTHHTPHTTHTQKSNTPTSFQVCNGAPRPRINIYSSEEYQFRGGRGVDYVRNFSLF